MHRHLGLFTLALLLSACGWQLRGYEQFDARGAGAIGALNLVSNGDNRLLQRTIQQQLKDLSIALDKQAQHQLVVRSENIERRPISFSSTGIPLQYQLIMTVRFAIAIRQSDPLIDRQLQARREYDFDTGVVVAKNEEERQLLQEMREELATRIIVSLGQ